jgi:hypothetical protein
VVLAAFVIAAGIAVVLIALIVVGRETSTLAEQPKQALYDLDEAVDFVAGDLPVDVSARLGYADVRAVLRWHLDYLRDRGVPDRRDRNRGGPVFVEDDEGIAFVLARADEAGLDINDVEVATILSGVLDYLRVIGAVGGEVPEPELGGLPSGSEDADAQADRDASGGASDGGAHDHGSG